jgi:hypothetical protein
MRILIELVSFKKITKMENCYPLYHEFLKA